MRKRFKLGDQIVQVDLLQREPFQVHVVREDQREEVVLQGELHEGEGRVRLDGRYVSYFVTSGKGGVWVTLAGRTWFFESKKKSSEADSGHGGFGAPMPGKVTRVLVTVGEQVAAGQVLVVMEAMKMEHRIAAPGPGTVTALHCSEGQLVDQAHQLLSFEPAEEAK